jgi:hypothetical protein
LRDKDISARSPSGKQYLAVDPFSDEDGLPISLRGLEIGTQWLPGHVKMQTPAGNIETSVGENEKKRSADLRRSDASRGGGLTS